MNKRVHTV